LAEDVGVFQRLLGLGLHGNWGHLRWLLLSTGTLDGKGCLWLGALVHKDAWSFEDLGLNLIGLEVDLEIPVLHLLGVGDHVVEVSYALYAVVRLLEETLSDVGHNALVFADLGWDTNENAELGWQINVLLLLLDLEQGLFWLGDLGFVDL